MVGSRGYHRNPNNYQLLVWICAQVFSISCRHTLQYNIFSIRFLYWGPQLIVFSNTTDSSSMILASPHNKEVTPIMSDTRKTNRHITVATSSTLHVSTAPTHPTNTWESKSYSERVTQRTKNTNEDTCLWNPRNKNQKLGPKTARPNAQHPPTTRKWPQ